MATRKSAGILLYRVKNNKPEFFLIHHGGPFWANKEEGAWSIPKGEFASDEEPLAAAIREFKEETGTEITGDFMELTPIKQKAGKIIFAWAVKGTIDAATIISNSFKMEWPPKSGQWKSFPEVDKAAWFDLDNALKMINPAQTDFINELILKTGL